VETNRVRLTLSRALIGLVAAAPVAAIGQAGVPPADLTVTASPAPLVPLDQTHPKELSGLTWAGEDRFYAVSDGQSVLHAYTIVVDRQDGHVASVTPGTSVPLQDANGRAWRGSDLEGVAFDAETGDVYVADEARSHDLRQAIRRHRLSDGRHVGSVQVQAAAFRPRRFRGGYGLESLSLSGQTLWTANEDTLSGDGPGASARSGGVVRLTRIEPGRPVSQWAYRTEPSAGALPYGAGSMSGVVDLVALPDGRMLVLERATSGSRGPGDVGGFISRLYLVDVTGATDIASVERLEELDGADAYTPVKKTLVWSHFFSLFGGPNNFEGLTLGPRLADGSRSLLLVADNDVLPSNLFALRISGLD
jgi:hypothetical protein